MNDRNWHDQLRAELNELEMADGLRRLRDTIHLPHGRALYEGREMLDLASNDYLGLGDRAFHPKEEMALPWGAGASRLVSGNHPSVREFEREFASFKQTEDVLLFNSGYTANIGIISALCGRGDIIFSDRLNHASMIDGALLSRAELVRYRHRDMNELEQALKKTTYDKKKLIVTDAVFSMDGTLAPLADLVTLKERYGALLMVDEAHSGGLFGADGQGLTHHLGLSNRVDLQMGTYSKAYGRFGAYVACSALIRDYLINKARAFMYTTALPPVLVAAIRQNWLRARSESWRRQHVLMLAEKFRSGLHMLGYNIGDSQCQIVPLIVGDNRSAIALAQQLQTQNILAVAIRPPTVPHGTARIRFSWTAAHSEQDVEAVLAQVSECLR